MCLDPIRRLWLHAPGMPGNWKQLVTLAQDEVDSILRRLPAALRDSARHVTLVCEPLPSAELVADGIEPDTLGLFQGEAYPDAAEGGPLPAHITLYLENLWQFSGADEEIYREEVGTTFLHELGHYLGLDEDDLEQRGLD